MLRHATCRANPLIAFDFLAPRWNCLPGVSAPKSFTTLHRVRALSSRVTPTPSAPSTSTATTTVLNELGFPPHISKLVEAVAETELNLFNDTIPELREALIARNIPKAWSLWSPLAEKHLLGLLGRADHDMYSRSLAAVCTEATYPSDPARRVPIQEMALVTAAGGATHALTACMHLHIKERDFDTVHRLYQRYRTLMEQKDDWKDSEGKHGPPFQDEQPQGRESTTNLADELFHDGHRGHENSHDGATPSLPKYPAVRADILLACITAYALQGSFHDALHTALQTNTRLTAATIKESMRILQPDQALFLLLRDYLRRIDTAKLLSRPSSLANHLSNLTKSGGDKVLEKLYSNVVAGLSQPDAWLTVHPVEVNERKLIQVPDLAWRLFLRSFLRCRRLDLAEKLWDDMNRFGVSPSVSVWNELIEGYGSLRKTDEALNIWCLMVEQGHTPDALTHRALVYSLFHGGRPDKAMSRFKDFQTALARKSLCPDEGTTLFVYNTALHGLLFHFREPEAQALFAQMEEEGPKPDIVSFNTFMRYHARRGDLKAHAAFMQRMELAGIKGDVYTFSMLLTALLKVRKDATTIMLNLMKKQGVTPNVAFYTTIINEQMKERTDAGFKASLEILEKMEHDGNPDILPNEITYTMFLAGIHRENWLELTVAEEYRQLISDKMKKRGIELNTVGYNILINACLENPEPEGLINALRYFREMRSRRVLIANDTWYIILRGLVSRQEWELAMELVRDIETGGTTPIPSLSELMQRVRRQVVQARRASTNFM